MSLQQRLKASNQRRDTLQAMRFASLKIAREHEEAFQSGKRKLLETTTKLKRFKTEMIEERNNFQGLTKKLNESQKKAYDDKRAWLAESEKSRLLQQQKELEDKEQTHQEAMAKKDQVHRQALANKDRDHQQALANKDTELANKDQELANKDQKLANKDQELANKDQELANKDTELANKDSRIEELEGLIQEAIGSSILGRMRAAVPGPPAPPA